MIASPKSSMTTLLSQELFDETVLENEQDLELSPEDAVQETIDQFLSQFGHDGPKATIHSCATVLPEAFSHLILSHPNSSMGKLSRENLREFRKCCDFLDSCVNSKDGKLVKELFPQRNRRETNDEEQIKTKLEREEIIHEVLRSMCQVIGKRCQMGDCCQNDSTSRTARDFGSSSPTLPYLSIFQRTCSIYTFMSFLSIVDPITLVDFNKHQRNNDHGNRDGVGQTSFIDQSQHEILQVTLQTLSVILSASIYDSVHRGIRTEEGERCSIVRSELKDLFVPALHKVVSLLGAYVEYFIEWHEDTCNHANDNQTYPTIQQRILISLLQLGTIATKGCEAGKVAFIQASLPSNICSESRTKRGGVAAIVSCLKVFAKNAVAPISENKSNVPFNNRILIEACNLLTSLCKYDDCRDPAASSNSVIGAAGVKTSSAHDHAMDFHRAGAEIVLVNIAKRAFAEISTDCVNPELGMSGDKLIDLAVIEKLVVAVFSSLRVLAVNDEIIQTMVALGILSISTKSLQLGITIDKFSIDGVGMINSADTEPVREVGNDRMQRLTTATLGLLRNLCGNDEIKSNLCLGSNERATSLPSILPSLMKAMQIYHSFPLLQEHACGAIAAMALRRPANARAIIDAGAPQLLFSAMKRHNTNVNIQRQGALAVRNIVSRLLLRDSSNGDTTTILDADERTLIRDTFLELGAEDVLRNIAGRHQGSVDEAYAALRDLGCTASLVTFDVDRVHNQSSVNVKRTMMFGDKNNSDFRPVFEESAGLQNGLNTVTSQYD